MKRTHEALPLLVVSLVASTALTLPARAGFELFGGEAVVERIASLGATGNRVMEHLEVLCNRIGARPAGSAKYHQSCQWALRTFESFGLHNAHLEECGRYEWGDDPTAGDSGQQETPMALTEAESDQLGVIYNVIADIVGSEKPDEYVIIGAHLDSAPLGTGATDNGSGVAAVMEAARILVESGAKPRRTIRFVLFGGEEVGLVGSKGYVKAHEEHLPRISAVYNMDQGSNYISEIKATEPLLADMHEIFAPVMSLKADMPFEVTQVDYLPAADPNCCPLDLAGGFGPIQGEEPVGAAGCGSPRVIRGTSADLEKLGISIPADGAMPDSIVLQVAVPGAPDGGKNIRLEDLDLKALGIDAAEWHAGGDTLRKMIAFGSSDHAPFLAAGVPAFIFGQKGGEPVPYPAHTAEDTYDKAASEYLKHSATVIALGALGTANLDHPLSRERLTATAEQEKALTIPGGD